MTWRKHFDNNGATIGLTTACEYSTHSLTQSVSPCQTDEQDYQQCFSSWFLHLLTLDDIFSTRRFVHSAPHSGKNTRRDRRDIIPKRGSESTKSPRDRENKDEQSELYEACCVSQVTKKGICDHAMRCCHHSTAVQLQWHERAHKKKEYNYRERSRKHEKLYAAG